jgi:uncharacterized protein (TIGR02145 family)
VCHKIYDWFSMKKLFYILSIWLFCSCTGDIDIASKKSPGDVISGNTTIVGLIGTQQWMTMNLNVAYFRNGDPIPHCKTNEERDNAGKKKQPCWCYYEDKSSNGEKYGKLYNWYAVMDSRGLAPAGWHVASNDEIDTLYRFLKFADLKVQPVGADGQVKSKNPRLARAKALKSTSGWDNIKINEKEEELNGNNLFGFNALPGGGYFSGGRGKIKQDEGSGFGGIGSIAMWWYTTKKNRKGLWRFFSWIIRSYW